MALDDYEKEKLEQANLALEDFVTSLGAQVKL
jgi:hypothetical protein